VPYIVETSAGADRVTLTTLVDAYREEQVEGETRVVLGFHPSIAPIKAGVFPLVKKDGMPEFATRLYHDLKRQVPSFYDSGRWGGATAWTGPARRSASPWTARPSRTAP
jgi:glycyl-tRNA synthetase